MKKTLLITLQVITSFFAKAQTNNADTAKIIVADNRVFTAVEKAPDFPGGINMFYMYLQRNMIYPPDAVKNRIEGRVFITFIVEKEGILSDIKVIKGVSPEIDNEAIRVISRSPRWLPGIVNGMAVRVQYTMAIAFKLPAAQVSKEQALMDSLDRLPSDKKIFTAVEIEPSFPGGIAAFYKFTQNTIHYPPDAVRNQIQGKVYLSFVVERDGSLSDIKISRGVSQDIDAEALRIIQISPKWNPGIQNGKLVRAMYTVPIIFALEGQ
jgi:TonB family protein